MTIGYQIRDAAYDRLSTMAGLRTKVKAAATTMDPVKMPFLSVSLARDNAQVDGDFVGEPHFLHSVTITIVLIDKAMSDELLDASYETWADQIYARLLRDPTFLALIEGVESINRTQDDPQSGQTFFGGVKIDLTLLVRSTWRPDTPDDFTSVDIKARPNGDAAVAVEYIFTVPS